MPGETKGPLQRYLKSSGFYFEALKEFFTKNEALRAKALEATAIYARRHLTILRENAAAMEET